MAGGNRVRTEQRISRERAPGYEIATALGPFQGAVAAPLIDGDYVHICFQVADVGALGNLAGAAAALRNLGAVNAALYVSGVSFPGGVADDNVWQVPFEIPDNYDPTRPIEIEINMVQE